MNSLLKYIAKLFSKDSGASFGRVMSFICIFLAYGYVYLDIIYNTNKGWRSLAVVFIPSLVFYIITKWADLKLTDILNKVIEKNESK